MNALKKIQHKDESILVVADISKTFYMHLQEIRTIYIKPNSERFKNILDVGGLEVITITGGRYVINNIKQPYVYHKAIIGTIVNATHTIRIKIEKRRRWMPLIYWNNRWQTCCGV